ncbi:hypothetical protein [Christensenella intestinihominis]|uniref:hypothetical protein n=1 Tax=Christensenella intestinihominis TaxID=1851429 RepID=UPI00082A127B|nr:hypothetical protein [Christensenella intestinihominis]
MKDRGAQGVHVGIGIGGVSILAVFVILCLTAFAALALTSAQADRTFAEKTAQAARAYYAADTAAEQRLAALAEAAGAPGFEAVLEGGGYTAEAVDGGILVSFTEPVDDTRELHVQVLFGLGPDGAPTGKWERVLWRTQALPYPEETQAANLLSAN